MAELLRGRLDPLQLTTLLQMASSDEVTGWLSVDSVGQVGFVDGAIVAAECGALRGTAALTLLVLRCPPQAAFVLQDDTPPRSASLGQTQWLVMRAAQYTDEWKRLAPQVLAVQGEATPDGLDGVARWMDGRRTVAEAVALGGGLRPALVSALGDAVEAGALVVAAPPDPDRAAAVPLADQPEDFFALVDEGRALLRARRLAEAELALARALRLRPDDRVVRQNLQRVQALRAEETYPSP